MVAIPFFYFSFLSFYIFKKNRECNIAFISTLMYVISAFFSILIDIYGLRSDDTRHYQISFLSVFVYCFLLTICIIPFIKKSNTKIDCIKPLKNDTIIKVFSVLSLIWFFISISYGWDSIVHAFTIGDYAEARYKVYQGEREGLIGKIPFPLNFFILVFNFVFSCPWVLLFCCFYCFAIQKTKWYFSLFYFLASINGPLNSIVNADRSGSTYWILSLIGIYFIFYKYIEEKDKIRIKWLFCILLFCVIYYITSVTIARFENKDGGASGGFIYYLGCSFINFAYFFDCYELPRVNLGMIFPFVTQYILGNPTNAVTIQAEMTQLSHINCGTFNTFIGQLIMSCGHYLTILFCCVYSILSNIAVDKSCKRKDVASLYLYFAFCSILFLGLFGYYYSSPTKNTSLFLFYILFKKLN